MVEEFKQEVLAEAQGIDQDINLNKFKKRSNFTHHKVITIDGEDARDFDDAISIERIGEGYKLYVHIADVSHYVTENSQLDKSAYQRGTSVYFPNMVIPMLPKELSNGVCSLQEGKNRLVLTVIINLDPNCNVISSEITEGVIKSAHRMTYTEVQNILNGDELLIEKYSDVYQDILDYQHIAKTLMQQRLKRGEMRMNIPEPFILENAEGEIISIEKRVQDESHEIIEALMVLTNECVAKKCYDIALPFVYRVHEKPDQEKVKKISQLLKNLGVANQLDRDGDKPISYQKIIDKITGDPKEKILTILILRSMMKARYASTCLGHFSLASEFYCHFTSPIRRYPDLIIHRIIKEHLHGKSVEDLKIKYKDIVNRASEQSSTTERNADEAEREIDDYKKSVYMSKFIGEEFEGIISGVQEFGIFVELDNGVEGLVRLDDLPSDEYEYDDMSLSLHGKHNHFTIGDDIKVVVANTNTKLHQIDFTIANVEPNNSNILIKNKPSKLNSVAKKSIKGGKKLKKTRRKRK